MLLHLHIRDFAIVEHLELEFRPGMSALTGETGAGKSILIDALGILLGDRADSDAVRHGADRADISAVFDVSTLSEARSWLSERDLDADTDCHLRRIINRNGRSRAYINGTPQPVQLLKELGERLVDIHGQHEHQFLLRRDAQRELLDDYGDHSILLATVAAHYRILNDLRQRRDALLQADHDRDTRSDWLRFQIDELETLNPQPDELSALEQEHKLLANAGRLLDGSQQALGWLYENEKLSVQSLLNQSLRQLETLAAVDERLEPIVQLLDSARIQSGEAGDELRQYLQQIDLEPERLHFVEQRLAEFDKLARKHRVSGDELAPLLTRLRAELDELDHSELRAEELERALAAAEQDYRHSAAELSARRATAASELAGKVGDVIKGLGMPNGRVELALAALPRPTPSGLDAVEFLVSANPGQPLRALNKVASGGELSRLSLAIQVIAARSARIPTLIFDEVDTGIGGGVAEVVGRQLKALGQNRQVLCVTHLPQVAAQAHQHLQIVKLTDGHTTRTTVTALDESARIAEVARMLGGLAVTEQTLAHAREMITHAQQH